MLRSSPSYSSSGSLNSHTFKACLQALTGRVISAAWGSKQDAGWCCPQCLTVSLYSRAQTRDDGLFIRSFIQLHLIRFSMKIEKNSFLITVLTTFGNHRGVLGKGMPALKQFTHAVICLVPRSSRRLTVCGNLYAGLN